MNPRPFLTGALLALLLPCAALAGGAPIDALGSPDPAAAAAALEKLVDEGDATEGGALGDLLLNGRLRAAESAGEAGCLAAGEVERAYRAAIRAAEALGRIGGRKTLAVLTRAFVGEQKGYDAIAHVPLCEAGEEDESEAPADAAGHDQLLQAIAKAMVAADPEPATALLLQTLEAAEERHDQIAAALPALASVREEDVTERLFGFLAARPWYAALVDDGFAARSWEEMGERLTRELLAEDPERVRFAVGVIERMSSGGAVPELDPAAVERLTEVVADQPPPVARAAAGLLHRARRDGRLVEALERGDLPALARYHVYYLLLGRPGSEAALARALESHGTVRMYQALRESGSEELGAAAEQWLREGAGREFGGEPGLDLTKEGDQVPWGGLGGAAPP